VLLIAEGHTQKAELVALEACKVGVCGAGSFLTLNTHRSCSLATSLETVRTNSTSIARTHLGGRNSSAYYEEECALVQVHGGVD